MTGAHHSQLERQLREATGPDGELDLPKLLQRVSQAYAAHEDALLRNERTFALMTSDLPVDVGDAQALAHTEAILTHASEALIFLDREGRITLYNRAAEEMFGWSPQEVLGRHVGMLMAGGWTEAHAEKLRENAGDVRLAKRVEAEGVRKDGSIVTVEGSLTRTESNGVVTLCGFWRDVSERKEVELTLLRAKDTAEAASRAKTDFLAAMSHEIRTPLNGVLGMAAALEATPLSEIQRRMIGVINESGQTLMTLLSDILDISKIEAGAMEMEVTPFDLVGCVEGVRSLFEATARGKGLNFSVAVDPEARGVFEGDPTRIRQVVQNLISNAMKFTATGEVSVHVSAAAAMEGRRQVRIEVSDTGVGLSTEAQSRLFSKFVQADSSTNRKFGGTGLGLAICRELVTAMGGDIGVESEEGRGSRFWFTLPLRVAEEAAAVVEEAAETTTEDAAPLRILAAEDNPTNQFVLKAILGQFGMEATFVDNGRLAVEAVRAEDFDLILMDLHMPEMDGITATQAIRAMEGLKSRTPVIAVTAEAMPEQVRKCMAAGMDGHVAKPIRPDVLLAVMEEVLTRTAEASAERLSA